MYKLLMLLLVWLLGGLVAVAQTNAPLHDGKPLQTNVKVDEKILQSYVGEYEIEPNFILAIIRDQNRLISQGTGQPKFELFAETETKFSPKEFVAQVEFVKNELGKVTKLILYQDGQTVEARKIK